jgi:hypothetical protein
MSTQKTWTREAIHDLLDRSDEAVMRALMTVYARQTDSERVALTTSVVNGVGFNQRDARVLSDIARKVPHYGRMTAKQTALVRGRIKKYWRQLLAEIEAKGGAVDYGKARRPAEDDLDEEIDEAAIADMAARAELEAHGPPKLWGEFA